MGSLKQPHPLMVEVSHQVNSPLAAIRNALYLAAQRTADPAIIHYLQIADDEVSSIVKRIRDLRTEAETLETVEAAAVSPVLVQSMGKAA